MRKFNIISIILCISSIHLFAQTDTNHTITTVGTLEETKELPKKKSKSRYKRFESLFSDYDSDFFQDMMVYPFDVMMPDEMFKAAKDVVRHRNKYGFENEDKEVPKTVCNDACNFLLTTGYYYMQDISHITQRVWDESICSPDRFLYDEKQNPDVILNLKENAKNAKGVTKNGIVLPFNRNFPLAQYPYASKPNGCSAEELKFVYNLSNIFSNDDKELRKACDRHDKCYFTEGTTYKECNEKFVVDALDTCNAISTEETLLTVGTKNAFCSMKSLSVATGANICAQKYFNEAQKKQKAYNNWVREYEKAYIDLKKDK